MVSAGLPPGDLRRRRAADAPIGAGARPPRCRRDAACATAQAKHAAARDERGRLWYGASVCVRPPNLGGRHLDASSGGVSASAAWLWRNRRSYDVIYVIHGRLHAFPAAITGNWLGKPVLVKPGRGGEAHFDLLVVQRKRLLGSFFARGIAHNTTAWVANEPGNRGGPRTLGRAAASAFTHSERRRDPGRMARRRSRNGVVHFLSMGRLDAEKAVDQTIRAFARCRPICPLT